MEEQIKTIEFWLCGYDARCNVRNCLERATMLARGVDSGGRSIKQYELCGVHTEQVAERERARGRQIINREVNHR